MFFLFYCKDKHLVSLNQCLFNCIPNSILEENIVFVSIVIARTSRQFYIFIISIF